MRVPNPASTATLPVSFAALTVPRRTSVLVVSAAGSVATRKIVPRTDVMPARVRSSKRDALSRSRGADVSVRPRTSCRRWSNTCAFA